MAASVVLDPLLRRRARALAARIEPVSTYHHADLRATTDARTRHFEQALGWARHVLLARGRTLHVGQADVWTFLIRTPEPIEAGIRALLRKQLPDVRVDDRGRQIDGTRLTLNPDLVFTGGLAVADVKYKLAHGEWYRPDLYQLVTFATGFGSEAAALISFAPPGVARLQDLQIGSVSVTQLPWPADAALDPRHAAGMFSNVVQQWLASMDTPSRHRLRQAAR